MHRPMNIDQVCTLIVGLPRAPRQAAFLRSAPRSPGGHAASSLPTLTPCPYSLPDYMQHALAIPPPAVPGLCLHFYTHGTLPYGELFPVPDATLRAILASLPQRLFVFTNADEAHAEVCLARLGIRDLLQGVLCYESIMRDGVAAGLTDGRRPVVCKPQAAAFKLALAAVGCAGNPASVAFFDDSVRNVDAGADAGVFSVLVGRVGVPGTRAAAQIASMHDLPACMPGLWGDVGGVPASLLTTLPAPLLAAERVAAQADAADTAANVPSYSAIRNAAVSPSGAAAAAAAHHGPASPRVAAAAAAAAAAAGGGGEEGGRKRE